MLAAHTAAPWSTEVAMLSLPAIADATSMRVDWLQPGEAAPVMAAMARPGLRSSSRGYIPI